jgi:hypothetical protein
MAAVVVAIAMIALRARLMKSPSCNGASGPRRPGVYPPDATAKPQRARFRRNPERRSGVSAIDPRKGTREERRW